MVAPIKPDQLDAWTNKRDDLHFPDAIFKCIFLNENIWIAIKVLLKLVPINNIPALVEIVAWHRKGDKQLVEPMVT